MFDDIDACKNPVVVLLNSIVSRLENICIYISILVECPYVATGFTLSFDYRDTVIMVGFHRHLYVLNF
jgi:hypothetical protein